MHKYQGGWLLAAGVLLSPAASALMADSHGTGAAQSADDVLGPVDAQHPLDPSASASAPMPAASPADAPQPEREAPPARPSRAVELTSPNHDTHVGISANVHILTGIGLSIGVPVFDQFNLRLAGNAFSISRDFDGGGNNGSNSKGTYNGKVKLLSYGLLTDWHPFHGAFRITAGGLKNGNEITLDSKSTGSDINIGNCTYTSNGADPLLAHGQTNFRGFAPYAGLGWGGNMNAAPGFFGTFDLGVMFSGSANIGLSAKGSGTVKSGPATECGAAGTPVSANDPRVQNQVAKDQADLNDKTDKVKLWPVIGFGFGWRF